MKLHNYRNGASSHDVVACVLLFIRCGDIGGTTVVEDKSTHEEGKLVEPHG